MRWTPGGRSDDLEDRRGESGGRGRSLAGGGLRIGAGGAVLLLVLSLVTGHHVQNVLGLSDRVREMQQRKPDAANQLSVLLELQADCFAGVWAHSTEQRDILERGDVEEGIGAAAAVGDDRIQKQAGGAVNPETWTHGSSQQRVEWFQRGRKSGTVADCNTFA
jgi:hypothetical protein